MAQWLEGLVAHLSGWPRGAEVLVFATGNEGGGRTGGGQISQRGAWALGGSLDEPVRADIPTLGFPETFPRYRAVGGIWAVGTRRLEVGAGSYRVSEVSWSAEVGSVTWVHPVTLTLGVGLRDLLSPGGTLELRVG